MERSRSIHRTALLSKKTADSLDCADCVTIGSESRTEFQDLGGWFQLPRFEVRPCSLDLRNR